ncbi:SMC-Scp complex subunit ScpB [Syntrophomonas palmitatica]|uniref:SMC-Scp complex subunit ScpB n=1 Tax=Syntrophomonas palmitatica TaxID=402877 RepID=UPI0006D1D05D|nr:SMC-Scp complex subunit ScpB [Syntrophomonas palmitatica]
MLIRDEIKAALEAILFIRAEPLVIEELVEILDLPLIDLKSVLDELILEYNEKQRGIQIVRIDNSYLMCTHPRCADIINRLEKPVRRRLSQAALETLAIIAYRQPVTKAEIENIRGVKSEKIVTNLLERGLIEEAGHKAVLGKPVLYKTSPEFLKVFGLGSLKELPVLEEA